jgi:hypothetical protein
MPVQIVLWDKRYMLHLDYTDPPFAVLNNNATTCFLELLEGSWIYYEAFIPHKEWMNQIQRWKITGKANCLSVDIVIYGPAAVIETVGQTLSKARYFLQEPHFCNRMAKYENPQYLKFTGSSSTQVDHSDPYSIQAAKSHFSPQYTLSSVLDGLHQHENLLSETVAGSIRTTLLR